MDRDNEDWRSLWTLETIPEPQSRTGQRRVALSLSPAKPYNYMVCRWDWCARQVMQGLIADWSSPLDHDGLVKAAYDIADAMLEARKQSLTSNLRYSDQRDPLSRGDPLDHCGNQRAIHAARAVKTSFVSIHPPIIGPPILSSSGKRVAEYP
jgi:hypothetical protein